MNILDRKTTKSPYKSTNMSTMPEGTTITGILHEVGREEVSQKKNGQTETYTMFDLVLVDSNGTPHRPRSSSKRFAPIVQAMPALVGHSVTVTFNGKHTWTNETTGRTESAHDYTIVLHGDSAEIAAWNRWSAEVLPETLTSAPNVPPAPAPTALPSITPKDTDENGSMAAQLINLARDRFDFAVVEDHTPYAVPKNGNNIAIPFEGGFENLASTLALTIFEETGNPAGTTPLNTAISTLKAMANRSTVKLELRFARAKNDDVVIDIGNATGDVIVINATGWKILTGGHPDVLFRRTELTLPMAVPVHPVGDLDFNDLARYVHTDPQDFPLVLAWMVCTILGHQTPIALLQASPGSGKTETGSNIVQLIDPTSVPSRKPPKDPESLITSFMGSQSIMLDNVTRVEPWMADSLCRVVTGDGDVRRSLYKDKGLTVFSFRRSLLITAVTVAGVTGDLADRTIMLNLPKFAKGESISESELTASFQRDRPALLGQILTLASRVMTELPNVQSRGLHRLGDFSRIMLAIDNICGSSSYKRYYELREAIDRDVIEEDSFGSAILQFLAQAGSWVGTSTELHNAIVPPASGSNLWPKTARAASEKLDRLGAQFAACGVVIDRTRDNRGRKIITISTNEKFSPPTMTAEERAAFKEAQIVALERKTVAEAEAIIREAA